jgi:hypothetical protein
MRVEPTTHLLPLAKSKHRTTNDNIYYKRVTRIIRKGNSQCNYIFIEFLYLSAQYITSIKYKGLDR